MKEGEDALYVSPDPVGEDISRIEMLKRLNILATGNKTSHKVQFNDSFDEESSEFKLSSNGSSTSDENHTILIFLVFFSVLCPVRL